VELVKYGQDQHHALAAVVARDAARERAHARLQLHRRDQDLLDVRLLDALDLEVPVAGLRQQRRTQAFRLPQR